MHIWMVENVSIWHLALGSIDNDILSSFKWLNGVTDAEQPETDETVLYFSNSARLQ